jgi:hypothetical protein
MTDEAMSPLHRRMIEDMAIWKVSLKDRSAEIPITKLLQVEIRRSS